MGDMIKDQTKQIKSMIDDQTEILLSANQAAIDSEAPKRQIKPKKKKLYNENELRIVFLYLLSYF